MSSEYYVGTFQGNQINKPLVLGSTGQKTLKALLMASGVDVWSDLNYCVTLADGWNPLFYSLDELGRKNAKYMKNSDKYEPSDWQSRVDLGEITKFPLICDGTVHDNGISYYMNDKYEIKEPVKAVKLDINRDNFCDFLPEDLKSFFAAAIYDDIPDTEYIEAYNTVIDWVEKRMNVYWYHCWD